MERENYYKYIKAKKTEPLQQETRTSAEEAIFSASEHYTEANTNKEVAWLKFAHNDEIMNELGKIAENKTSNVLKQNHLQSSYYRHEGD
jgi:hypothetical protein